MATYNYFVLLPIHLQKAALSLTLIYVSTWVKEEL